MVGAQRIEQGAGGKAQLLLLDRIDALDRIGHGGDLLGHHQIGLMDQREEGIVAPARIGKALVLPGQIDRLVLGAKAILADHLAPQVQAVGPQFLLHGGARQRREVEPALHQPHPARRIGHGGDGGFFSRQLAGLLVLEIEPHGLQLAHDLGPMAGLLRGGKGQGQAGHHRSSHCCPAWVGSLTIVSIIWEKISPDVVSVGALVTIGDASSQDCRRTWW
jgi:hypothetical protein